MSTPSTKRPSGALAGQMRAFYRRSTTYYGRAEHQSPHRFDRYLAVADAVLPHGPARLLEIGSGAGAAIRRLQAIRPEATFVGCDLATFGLGTLGQATGVCADALAQPFRDHSFDGVLLFEVIEHLPDIERALNEALRLLAPSGIFVAGVPNHASLWVPLQDLLWRRRRLAFGVDGPGGALRWLVRNLRIMARKRVLGCRPLYRQPRLDGSGGDADAVYYACPLDVSRHLASHGARRVTDCARLRWRLGGLVPAEARGSAVMAFRARRTP